MIVTVYQENKMKKGLKNIFSGKKKWISIPVLIILVIVLYQVFTKNSNEINKIVSVTRGNLKQEVLVSGIVKAKTDVDLAFEKSGTVAFVNKEIGDKIYAGETIISLKNDVESANLNEAKALLESKKARFNELSNGGRPEEIAIKEISLKGEIQKLTNYYNNVPETINGAFNNADNAVNKQTDDLFSNDNSNNPQLTFNVYDQKVKNDALTHRLLNTSIIADLNTINDRALSQELPESEYESSLKTVKSDLIKVQELLIILTEALNKTSDLTDTTIATYKTSVATGRSDVNTAIQSVTTLIENINSQKITIEKTKSELDLLKLGATPSVLSQARSDILQAEAKVQSATANLAKTYLRSPITGIVSRLEISQGELVGAGSIIASIISNQNFIIEANLPESDLSKISIGNKTEITLDAFSEDRVLDATLIEIEPAERIIDGVATYKIKFAFVSDTIMDNIKPGMTANITIATKEKTNILIIPTSTINEIDGKTFVTLITDIGQTETEIQTGLKEFNKIEVITGLEEGDKILEPIKVN